MRVYKFKMVKQLTLLGYSYEDGAVVLELLTFGSHENFYRDAKKLFWVITAQIWGARFLRVPAIICLLYAPFDIGDTLNIIYDFFDNFSHF